MFWFFKGFKESFQYFCGFDFHDSSYNEFHLTSSTSNIRFHNSIDLTQSKQNSIHEKQQLGKYEEPQQNMWYAKWGAVHANCCWMRIKIDLSNDHHSCQVQLQSIFIVIMVHVLWIKFNSYSWCFYQRFNSCRRHKQFWVMTENSREKLWM